MTVYLVRHLCLTITLVVACVCVVQPAHSQDINFDDLQRQGPALSVTLSVPGLGAEGYRFLSQFNDIDSGRVQEARERAKAYQNSASSEGSTEGTNRNVSGQWTLVRTYDGGFADFGLDKHRPVSVIKCGNGRERKVFQGNNGKWGTGSFFSNHSASTFEQGAKEACE